MDIDENVTDNGVFDRSAIDPSILKRIRGLFKTAESLVGTPAAESYEDKALELLAKHGISERVARLQESAKRAMTKKVIRVEGQYLASRRSLIAGIARELGVYATWNYDREEFEAYKQACRDYNVEVRDYNWMGGPKPGKKPSRPPRNSVTLYGYDTDIERTELLYVLLSVQSIGALKKVTAADVPWHFSGNLRSWRISFFEGWIRRIEDRIREMERKEVEEVSSSTALVLVNPLAEAKAFAEAGGNKAKNTKRTLRSGQAYRAGYAEGDNADIGQTRVGNRQKALAG